ncbi:unnamed protein product [Rhizophagus irregularis]|nr:unnamed protein product [Rhizophagus irregularis]
MFRMLCIEKQLLYIKPSICPYPDCGKNVDIIIVPNSPVILEDPMEGVEASSTPRNTLVAYPNLPDNPHLAKSRRPQLMMGIHLL